MNFKDEKELEELKNEKIKYTIEYVYNNSPFYRELMDKEGLHPKHFQKIEDLEHFPIVTPNDILENQPPISEEYNFKAAKEKYIKSPFFTSGTATSEKIIYKSHDEWKGSDSRGERTFKMAGIDENSVVVNYFPRVGLCISGPAVSSALEKIGASDIPIGSTSYDPKKETELIMKMGGDTMVGLTSHIDAKGRKFEKAGINPKDLGIRTLLFAGEPSSQSKRESIRKKFGAEEAYDFYGTTEFSFTGSECKEHKGIHMFEDSIHFDIYDKEMEKFVEEGRGNIILTSLLNPGEKGGMPLINYDIGDITKKIPENCRCGRNLARISNPRRQKNEFVLGAVNLNPEYFEEILFDENETNLTGEYQLEVNYNKKRGDVLTVKLERDGKILPIYTKQLKNRFIQNNKHLEDTINTGAAEIEIKYVDELKMPPGKPNRLVDNREY